MCDRAQVRSQPSPRLPWKRALRPGEGLNTDGAAWMSRLLWFLDKNHWIYWNMLTHIQYICLDVTQVWKTTTLLDRNSNNFPQIHPFLSLPLGDTLNSVNLMCEGIKPKRRQGGTWLLKGLLTWHKTLNAYIWQRIKKISPCFSTNLFGRQHHTTEMILKSCLRIQN